MATAPVPVALEDYLNTSYSPDREYLDGVIREKNVGKGPHSYTQAKLARRLDERCEAANLVVLTEQRTRVAPVRIRIPDVCVTRKLEFVTTEPPVLCVEVRSPEDRWSRINASIADYHEMGVPCVWVVDPFERRAWIFDADAPPEEVTNGKLRADALQIEIDLAAVLPPAIE